MSFTEIKIETLVEVELPEAVTTYSVEVWTAVGVPEIEQSVLLRLNPAGSEGETEQEVMVPDTTGVAVEMAVLIV